MKFTNLKLQFLRNIIEKIFTIIGNFHIKSMYKNFINYVKYLFECTQFVKLLCSIFHEIPK